MDLVGAGAGGGDDVGLGGVPDWYEPPRSTGRRMLPIILIAVLLTLMSVTGVVIMAAVSSAAPVASCGGA